MNQWTAIAWRLEAVIARLLVSAPLLWQASVSRAADVGISIRLDSDWVELIRAQRRAQGIDAPDPHADVRVAALLQRVEQQRARTAAQSTQRTRHGVVAVSLPSWVIVY